MADKHPDNRRTNESQHNDYDWTADGLQDGTWNWTSKRSPIWPGSGEGAFLLVDMCEDNDSVFIKAMVPGVDPEEIVVGVTPTNVVFAGTKSTNDETGGHHTQTVKKYVRTVNLPVLVDAELTEVEKEDGVFYITLPKLRQPINNWGEINLN